MVVTLMPCADRRKRRLFEQVHLLLARHSLSLRQRRRDHLEGDETTERARRDEILRVRLSLAFNARCLRPKHHVGINKFGFPEGREFTLTPLRVTVDHLRGQL
jgi:hypothetical protein